MSLNKIERLKAELAPAAFAERLASLDYGNVDEAQRFYLKNYGIYNIKLRPEAFMLRLRCDGGEVPLSKARALCDIAARYDASLVVTARAQLELHGLHSGNVYRAYCDVQEAGWTTHQTLTDNVRAIITDPLEGLRSERIGDARGVIAQMRRLILDNPAYMGTLPRKFNTAVTLSLRSHVAFMGNDVVFLPARRGNAEGVNVYVGGKNSETARCADVFCLPEEIPALFKAVLDVFIAHGLSGSRAKTRLFHLLEAKGTAWFRDTLQAMYGKPLERRGELLFGKCDAKTRISTKHGGVRRIESNRGEIARETFAALVKEAETYGATIRLGADQAFYLIGVPEATARDTSTRPLHMTVCAGARYCPLSLWDMKEEAEVLPLERLRRLRVRVGMSGCLKGCGRHYHADIGIVGLRTNAYGETQKAGRIFLGGGYTYGKKPARLLYASVPLKHLRSLVEAILDEFEQSGEDDFEAFSRRLLWPRSEAFLAMWFAAKLYLRRSGVHIALSEEAEKAQFAALQRYEGFLYDENDEGYINTIRYLTHALWDDKDA